VSKFAPGDTVRIRDWDDMAAEYGVTDGDIDIGENRPWFTQPMRQFCGMVCTVTAIETVNRYELVRIKEVGDDPNDSIRFWNFCDEMLEFVYSDTLTEISETDFDLLLGVEQ